MSATGDPNIRILINTDATVARVIASADADTTYMTPETLGQIASGYDLHIDQNVMRRIGEVCASFIENPRDIDEVIAEAVDPIAGIDGVFEWMPGFDPQERTQGDVAGPRDAPVDREPHHDDDQIDHYNSKCYVRVEEHVHVATLHEPTGGTDGMDVLGRVIPATPGQKADVTCHHTVEVQPDGTILTTIDGVRFDRRVLRVSRLMEVTNVDFSTGNVTFDGSVVVHKGVKDNFVVEVTEDLTVHGLVEAAELLCGRDLVCRRGVAARNQGRLEVGGNADVGFLNDVDGEIRGNLTVSRELMNCEIAIGGNLYSERGSIIGGTTSVTGAVDVRALGSEADPVTILELGSVPLITGQLRRLDRVIKELNTRLRTVELEHMELDAILSPSNGDKEKLTELSYELSEYRAWLTTASQKRETLHDVVQRMSRVDVLVRQAIHPRVALRFGDQEAVFTKMLTGPIRIYRDEKRRLFYRHGDTDPVRLAEVAQVKDLAA